MVAEQLKRQRSFLAILAFLYVLVSLVAFVSGGPVMSRIPWHLMVVLHCLLGPIAFLAHAIWGWGYPSMADWSVQAPAIIFHVLSTVLLIGCLLLAMLRSRFARWTGYIAAAMIWIGSGFLMSVILAYGA